MLPYHAHVVAHHNANYHQCLIMFVCTPKKFRYVTSLTFIHSNTCSPHFFSLTIDIRMKYPSLTTTVLHTIFVHPPAMFLYSLLTPVARISVHGTWPPLGPMSRLVAVRYVNTYDKKFFFAKLFKHFRLSSLNYSFNSNTQTRVNYMRRLLQLCP